MTVSAPSPATPTYRGHPLWGALPAIRDRNLEFFAELATLGDVARFRVGPFRFLQAIHPDHIHQVLVDHQRLYVKQTRGYSMLRLMLGEGLVTSEGEFWRRQRRIIQPAFHRQRIESFAEVMTRAAEETGDRWERAAATREPIDVAREMMRLTLRIVGETLLSRDVSADADEVGTALTVLLEYLDWRMSHPMALPDYVPTAANRRFREARETLDRLVLDIIEQRRSSGETKPDLLALLMSARDEETGRGMDDRQLRDEVMTIFLAGHETTAVALSWTFYLLSCHPEQDEQLRGDLQRVLGGRRPELADLSELPLTEWVFLESMRLFPPVWMIARRAAGPDQLGDHPVRTGDNVLMPVFLTHRRPDVWERPDAFEPSRFEPSRFAAIPRSAYIPFSLGQRKCIGDVFATLEGRLVLATLLRRFRLRTVPGYVAVREPSVTLRPRDGMPMTVERVG